MAEDPTPEGLFERGLPIRRAVLGADYVDASLADANEFMSAFQHVATEMAWGYVWTRPGLDRRTRSLLNLAMLTALKAPAELKLHVRGALANGVTADEIKEVCCTPRCIAACLPGWKPSRRRTKSWSPRARSPASRPLSRSSAPRQQAEGVGDVPSGGNARFQHIWPCGAYGMVPVG